MWPLFANSEQKFECLLIYFDQEFLLQDRDQIIEFLVFSFNNESGAPLCH